MNVVYRTVWTEYEAGWGQRPDGVSYAFDKARLEKHIKYVESLGDTVCFSRAEKISMCIINDELRQKIADNNGLYTSWHNEDPGMLGEFKPKDPKVNVETFRQGMAKAA